MQSKKTTDIADTASADLRQLAHSLDEYSTISSKYSNYIQKIADYITPVSLLVVDILLLCGCLLYITIYHPYFVQLNPALWISEMQNPTNPSMALLFPNLSFYLIYLLFILLYFLFW